VKLPFLSKLGAITGVFSRLNPKALFAKVNLGGLLAKIKRNKGGSDDEHDEDDFRPSTSVIDEEDDFLGDLGDLDELDAEIKASEQEREVEKQREAEAEAEAEAEVGGEGDDEEAGEDADTTTDDLAGELSDEEQVLADLEAMPDFDEGDSGDDEDDEEDEAAAKAKMKKMAMLAGAGVVVAILMGGGSWLLLGGKDAPASASKPLSSGQTVFNLDSLPPAIEKKPAPTAPAPAPATHAQALTPSSPQTNKVPEGVLSGGHEIDSSGAGGQLALLGLDKIQQPGAGIVVPSTTNASYTDLKRWPPSKPLEVAPLPSLVKQTDIGLLPMVAKDGHTSFDAYARPEPQGDVAKPTIAIVVTGLGTSRASTEASISRLPSDITLALDVYARGLDFWIKRMRANGHEVLLEMPMESGNFPFVDAGPSALLALASPEDNIKKLEFILSRTAGYFGVLAVYGSKFLAISEQVQGIMAQLKKRGLMYVDNGAKGSVGASVAYKTDLPWAQIEMDMDVAEGQAAMRRQFTELEALAKKHAKTAAMISATPLNLKILSAWLKQLDAKGFKLVPISALSKKQMIQ